MVESRHAPSLLRNAGMIFRLPHARAHHVSRKEYPMPWLALCTAVVTEIIWGLSLKWAPTTSRPLVAALIPIVLSFLNMGLLAYAMRFLPAGLSYALWTGLGSIGVAVGGMLFFQDRISLPQAGFMLLILVGCIGARLAAPQD